MNSANKLVPQQQQNNRPRNYTVLRPLICSAKSNSSLVTEPLETSSYTTTKMRKKLKNVYLENSPIGSLRREPLDILLLEP